MSTATPPGRSQHNATIRLTYPMVVLRFDKNETGQTMVVGLDMKICCYYYTLYHNCFYYYYYTCTHPQQNITLRTANKTHDRRKQNTRLQTDSRHLATGFYCRYYPLVKAR